MRFFLPGASNPKMAEDIYQAIRRFIEERHGALADTRYYSITFMRGGKPYSARIGEEDQRMREPVIAIFRQAEGGLYFICTPSHGIILGGPLEGEILDAITFDPP